MIDESAAGTSSEKNISKPVQRADSDSIPRQDILTAAKGGGIAFAGMIFGYSIRFIFGIIVARTLGAEQWGLYALGITVATTLSTISLLGLDAGVVRYLPIANRTRDKPGIWGIIQIAIALPTLVSLIISGCLFLLAEPISIYLFNDPRLIQVFQLFSVCIPLATLIITLSSITKGFKQMQYEVYANNIVFYLVKFPLTLVMLVIGWEVLGLVVAHIVASAVALVMLIYFVHTLFPLNQKLSKAKRNLYKLLRFSLPIYLAKVVERLGGELETLMLGFLGLTIGVGIYSAALRLSNVGIMFYLSIIAISAPIISDMYSRGDYIQLKTFYQTTAKWSMTFNIPIFLILTIFAEPLLSIFGEDFTSGSTGLIILAFGPLISSSSGLGGTVINMTGYSKLTLVNSSLFLLTSLGFGLFFIPLIGVPGAALATTIAVAVRNFLQMGQVFYIHRMLPFNITFLKPIIAGFIAAGLTYIIKPWLIQTNQVINITLGVISLLLFYSITLFLFKFSDEDRVVLDRIRNNFKNITSKRLPS